jgi:uncharacterized LabA/DUF88 family protein
MGYQYPRGFCFKDFEMLRIAILIDGAFFLKRFKHKYPNLNAKDPKVVTDILYKTVTQHVHVMGKSLKHSTYLYRIFFYDCLPLENKGHFPISEKGFDWKKSEKFQFKTELLRLLSKKRKVALRLGDLYLDHDEKWTLKDGRLKTLIKYCKGAEQSTFTDEDFKPNVIQKGVDIRIGLDIASLSYKKQVDTIILISGDSDFVPAAKLARREGIDFILDPMGQVIRDDLSEHVDGIRSITVNLEDFQAVSDSITHDTP